MLPKKYRLTKEADIQTVMKTGKKTAGKFCLVFSLKKESLPLSKFCIIASKKVGNAVVRNRSKRLLREAVYQLRQSVAADYYVVIIAHPTLPDQAFEQIKEDVKNALIKSSIIV